jgi:pimeloyl-ACP methyl ester carboxylesterase
MAAFQQEIRFATSADGVRIAYAQSGRGEPLVRAAHWMTHLECDWQTPVWGPWLQALGRHHRLLRYDSRGSGLSDRDVVSLSLDDLVLDLEAVVDAAGLERFVLLGLSHGGAVAIRYAARHPERVSRLVLFAGFARGPLARGAASQPPEVIDALCRLVENGWGQANAAFRQMFTTQFWPRATAAQWDSFNEQQRLSCTPAHAARMVRAFAAFDASTDLARIACPTLVLHSRGDARVPFDEGRIIAAGIAGARLEPLASDNHLPLEGEPAFADALSRIDAFLRDAAVVPGFAGLSAREHEVVELLARGLDNAQIAAHLTLAEKTVRNLVSAVFDKLGAENRPQAIVRAREAGFGQGPASRS